MSKYNSTFTNGSNDDTGEEELYDKKHVDEGKYWRNYCENCMFTLTLSIVAFKSPLT
jgi:hypothetical protein